MLEITGDDIALLSDGDLRNLIGLLCEADLRKRGLPTSVVTWGGDQDAKDGGIDVRVALPAGTLIDGFIPRAATGFQVKKPDMPPSAIGIEMKPKGTIRPAIGKLAKVSGAYIIVSSDGSVSDSALADRKKAMADAIAGLPDALKLALDFYDRTRIASWVREHPGMVLWVRSRIGKAIPGWVGLEAWSHASVPREEYLTDDNARIHSGSSDEGEGLSAVDGITKMRDVVRQPGKVVRLVGLSGVGKTRFIEALFDERIGSEPLDPAWAVYTNVSDDPDPQPIGMASDLNAAGNRAVLIVDNCGMELHRRLSDIARIAGSVISVITVEYDIRDDQPEGTDVFKLEPSSALLAEKLIIGRFSNVSRIDAETIANFSGGNARIAIALAETVRAGESIKGLSNVELFKRLFEQRHEVNEALYLIGQAAALVYSFDGEDVTGDTSEMAVLGHLIGTAAPEMYRGVQELCRRDLVQSRSQWRAVLPHAIANRLAEVALQNIPFTIIQAALIDGGSPRLLKSFSRRLGYLDRSKEARRIVGEWLSPNGLLAEVAYLNEEQQAILYNVAPVLPEAALGALERALATPDPATLNTCRVHIRLLRSLAYDPALFDRAVALLVKLAMADTVGRGETDASKAVVSLFSILLSGTHASVEQRLGVLGRLLASSDKLTRQLGLDVLEVMLKTGHFTSSYRFEFGAHSRDDGWQPRTAAEVGRWFRAVLQFLEPFAVSPTPVTEQVRKAIGSHFRGLWTTAGRFDELEYLGRSITGAAGFWREGWIGARQTLRYDGNGLKGQAKVRLVVLEGLLRPKNLVNQVRGVVLETRDNGIDLDDFDEDEIPKRPRDRREATISRLGAEVALDAVAFNELLPELVEGRGQLLSFGRALACAADDPGAMWESLVAAYAASAAGNTRVLSGFLLGLQSRDVALMSRSLNEALRHPALAPVFPSLQTSVATDVDGAKRLICSLKLGAAPTLEYDNLANGRACDLMPGRLFCDLLLGIASKPGGQTVALHILSMRIFSDRSEKRETVPEAVQAGRRLMAALDFSSRKANDEVDDSDLALVASACLGGGEGLPVATGLCQRIIEAMNGHSLSASDYAETIYALCELHATAMLNTLFAGDTKAQARMAQNISVSIRHRKNPLDAISDEVLLAWCDEEAATRYPLIVSCASLSSFNGEQDERRNWKPLSVKLLEKAPSPDTVLNAILARMQPMSWSGSLASEMETRLRFIEELALPDRPGLAEVRIKAVAAFKRRIEVERKSETEEERQRSGNFE
ncbi:hypothetical protein [Nitrobacter vulgaris]|uniref:Uncharacterized protein n=1 Tax=Nitrobacter vulgaris TaxID=29421 RepID=A0A1V4HV17_NITVU|nr:hypothetical protein [Nitrobacter vulgaris]OPH81828.1 hypothetical protein B2M20_15225 [Nitrobacter vulgaris]